MYSNRGKDEKLKKSKRRHKRRHRSRSLKRHHKHHSRTAKRHQNHRSQSVEHHHERRSNSIKHQSQSVERHHKRRSGSKKNQSKHQSRSAKRHRKHRSRSAKRHQKHRSQSVGRHRKHRSQSVGRHRKRRSQSVGCHRKRQSSSKKHQSKHQSRSIERYHKRRSGSINHQSQSIEPHRRRRSNSHRECRNKHKSKRRKPSLYWDVPPIGFENVTPLHYKTMQENGKIPFSTELNILKLTSSDAGRSTVKIQARRLYVGRIPFDAASEELMLFINQHMHLSGLSQDAGNPVIACQINFDKVFAFLEFRSIVETTRALVFDGVCFKNCSIKIRRPHDYQLNSMIMNDPFTNSNFKNTSVTHGSNSLSLETSMGSSNEIYIGGLCPLITYAQLREFLSSYGELKSFRLINETNGLNKGYAFCEYVNSEITDQVISSVNGLLFRNKILNAHRVNNRNTNSQFNQTPVKIQVPGLTLGFAVSPTKVLCLLNMVSHEELKDNEQYADILEDIRVECMKYGVVQSIDMPRPIDGIDVPGCGKVYVEFTSIADCEKAQKSMSGREFNKRIVVTSYIDLHKYYKKEY